VDAITLIVTALAAGGASVLQDGTSAAVKDAYERVRALVRNRFAGRLDAEMVLARHEAAPQVWQGSLVAELTASGAENDADLVAAAQALMRLVDAVGAESGKYAVTVRGSQGIQIGDYSTQTNTFWPHPDSARDPG
jgi:Lon protease-like protein